MANQIWIFHIHISKMTFKIEYEKNLDAFDCERHIDSLTPLLCSYKGETRPQQKQNGSDFRTILCRNSLKNKRKGKQKFNIKSP